MQSQTKRPNSPGPIIPPTLNEKSEGSLRRGSAPASGSQFAARPSRARVQANTLTSNHDEVARRQSTLQRFKIRFCHLRRRVQLLPCQIIVLVQLRAELARGRLHWATRQQQQLVVGSRRRIGRCHLFTLAKAQCLKAIAKGLRRRRGHANGHSAKRWPAWLYEMPC